MSAIDRELARHLAAYRTTMRPAPTQRDRVWDEIEARAAAGESIDLDDHDDARDDAQPRDTRRPPRGRWAIAAVVIVGVVGGAAAFRLLDPVRLSSQDPSRSTAVYGGDAQTPTHEANAVDSTPSREHGKRLRDAAADRPARDATPQLAGEQASDAHARIPDTADPATITTAPAGDADAGARIDGRGRVDRTPKRRAPKTIEQPSIDTEEIALLRRAQNALATAPAHALDLLLEHAQHYPRSSLLAEREIARVTALCNLGQVDKALARADAFEAAYPSSPLLPRMRRVCSDAR